MTGHQFNAPTNKISLQEAMKQQLEMKKRQSSTDIGRTNANLSTNTMKSQLTKKSSKTCRKVGV